VERRFFLQGGVGERLREEKEKGAASFPFVFGMNLDRTAPQPPLV
jgi:hypothetical protein